MALISGIFGILYHRGAESEKQYKFKNLDISEVALQVSAKKLVSMRLRNRIHTIFSIIKQKTSFPI